jgi:hypothetical protein
MARGKLLAENKLACGMKAQTAFLDGKPVLSGR